MEVEEHRGTPDGEGDHNLLESLLFHANTAKPIGDRHVTGPISDVLARKRRIVIRGEAGSGKTTFLRWLAVSVAKDDYFDNALKLWNNLVPFYIRLREVNESGFPTPNQYAAQLDPDIGERLPSNNWADSLLKQGRAVLLIDGIDELAENRRDAFLKRLKRVVERYPLARFVVTSRPAATSKDNWPDWFEWANDAEFAEVMIKPMDTNAIEAFIDHWHRAYAAGSLAEKRPKISQAQQQLKRMLPQRPSLYRLAENPLLCSMICALHYDREGQLPAERIKLYKECIDMMLEQRDPGRKIAPKDYPPLSSGQKLALLQALAYRMMRNGEVELSVERVDKEFADLLPQFSATPASAADVRDYFVERSSLLREPVVGKIDFRHRTFQEFFAAQAIAEDGEVGYLLAQANNEQWRDTFPLAAAMLRPREVDELLQALIADGAPLPHRALALACLETAVKVDPGLRKRVFDSVPELFPPYARQSQAMLAAAGEHAIPYLLHEHQPNRAAMAAAIRTLAMIGGKQALQAIEGYRDVDSDVVRGAIDNAWPSFDHVDFADRLLQQRIKIAISDIALMPVLDRLPNLESLTLSFSQVSDLSSLASVPNLESLNLSRTQVSDLSSLASVPNLQSLFLRGTQVSDLSSLAKLPQLEQLYI